jgi:hypothetical protein
MTQLLLVAVLGMGGLLAVMVIVRNVMRDLGGVLIFVVVCVLAVAVAGSVGVTALHRFGDGLNFQIGPGTPGPSPGPSPTPQSSPTHIPGPPPELLAAERKVAAMGYEVSDPGTFHPENALHVLVGVAGDGGAVPHHEWAFFFDGNGRLLGEDAPLPSASLLVIGQGPANAALAYQLYAADDDDCCPSLGKAAVRFRLDRGRMRRLDPLPAVSARRACCGVGTTPPSEPVPRGSTRQ